MFCGSVRIPDTPSSTSSGPLACEVITTGVPQTLFLDEKDHRLIMGKQVILIDDVVSTGSTLQGMQQVMTKAGAVVSRVAAVFTEGDGDWSHVTALGNLPVFIDGQTA